MFRLIDKNKKIIYYNYKDLGLTIVPTRTKYKILKDGKNATKDFIVSVSADRLDSQGKLLFTEDKVDFDTENTIFQFGTIKYKYGFVIETKNGDIPLCKAVKITLSDEYNDPLTGEYL